RATSTWQHSSRLLKRLATLARSRSSEKSPRSPNGRKPRLAARLRCWRSSRSSLLNGSVGNQGVVEESNPALGTNSLHLPISHSAALRLHWGDNFIHDQPGSHSCSSALACR